MHATRMRTMRAGGLAAAFALITLGESFMGIAHAPSTPRTFHYGYDLSNQAPIGTGVDKIAAASAVGVMSSLPGTYDDVSLMGWGSMNPEPSPGVYDFTELAKRIALVQQAGGIPVLTLAGVPDWMKGGAPGTTNWSTLLTPPDPAFYPAFAALAAKVAETFPQVRYFAVWREMQGFYNPSVQQWDAASFTDMYNDVYTAVKAVRPDDLIGGPYAPLPTRPLPFVGAQRSAVQGSWGYVIQPTLTFLQYWLAHKVGADFLAVDGNDVTPEGTIVGNAYGSVLKYGAVDAWLKTQTSLPIWWMESHLQPRPWSTGHAAAARVGALTEMATTGTAVGMQWQPQDQSGWYDEGLWTSPDSGTGGRPTPLAMALRRVLPILEGGATLEPGEPWGVLVARGAKGTLAVNMTVTSRTAVVDGARETLAPNSVKTTS